jgi:hypothetical protein
MSDRLKVISPGEPPILPVTDGYGHLLEDANLWLLAVLRSPSDKVEQARYVADRLAQNDRHARALAEELKRGSVDATLGAVSHDQQIRQSDPQLHPERIRVHSAMYHIDTVAQLLITALNSPPERKRGIKYARGLLEQFRARSGVIARDQKYIKEAWASHQSVAHFCAALVLWAKWTKLPPGYEVFEILDPSTSHHARGHESFNPDNLETLPNFLAAAEALRLTGENHYPVTGSGGKTPGNRPLLDPSRTYRPPTDLSLPTVGVRLRGVPPKLNPLSMH